MRKVYTNSLDNCTSHLHTVATVPWEIKKVVLNSIIHTYFRRTKQLLPYLPHLKMLPHYLVKCTHFSSFSFFTRIEYQSAIRTSCGSVLMAYSERLKACKLPTLHYRHTRGDVIEMFKLLSGKYDLAVASRINREYRPNSITRGNDLRLQKHRTKYDMRKYFFY